VPVIGSQRTLAPPVGGRAPARARARMATAWVRHRVDLAVLAPLLLATGALVARNHAGAPARSDGEGLRTAMAWSLLHDGAAGPFTGRAPEPPAAVAQLSAYTGATGAFERLPTAVGAGREAMLVVTVVTAGLIWVLARRLDLPRWAAGLAVVLFTLPPPVLEMHRTVTTAGLGVGWALLALVTAHGRHRLAPYAAGLLAVVAVATDGTMLLLVPAVLFTLWWRDDEPDDGVVRVVWALVGLFLAHGAATLLGLPTVVVGPLGPGAEALPAGLDIGVVPALVVAAATLGGLALRRLRPLGLTAVALGAVAALPGAVPQSVVIALVPVGALLVAGCADGFVRYRPTRLGGHDVRPLTAVVAVAAPLLVVALVAPGWAGRWSPLLAGQPDRPLAEATAWLSDHAPRGDRIVVDDSVRVDLVRQGREGDDLLWHAGPEVAAGAPWVVSTAAVRRAARTDVALAVVLDGSRVVASFGRGDDLVEIRSADADAVAPAPAPADAPAGDPARRAAGRELLANPSVLVTGPARADLLAGRVDPRVLTTLAVLAATRDVGVDGFLRVPGDPPGTPLRIVRIVRLGDVAIGGSNPAVEEVIATVSAQTSAFRPSTRLAPIDGENPAALVLTFPSAPT
jgi:hypothetical protein